MPFSLPTEGTDLGNILMAAGVIVLALVMLISVRRRWGRSQSHAESSRLDPHERLERSKQLNGMRGDLRTMMVELEELTRRFSAQLDAKSLKLEKLIREADQRIARLNGQSPDEAPRPQITERSPLTSSSVLSGSPDPLARNVYDLADAGNDAEQIARRLGEHVGKVELILALRKH